MPRRVLPPVALLALTGGLSMALTMQAPAALATSVTHNRVVSANPANVTPNVVSSGSVQSLAQVGSTMVAGGQFTQVAQPGGPAMDRTNLFSFDATTGRISSSFRPTLDGMVRAVVPGPSGTVFVGGEFKNVNGVARTSLVKLNLSDGSIATSFKTPLMDGRVFTMAMANGRLLIGGSFTRIAGRAIPLLAALDPVTGAVVTSFAATFTGTNNPQNPGFRVVRQLAVSPNGTRLVAIGNFMQVNGLSRPQIAQFGITASAAQLLNWHTDRYARPCSQTYQSYVRDVDFAPDGSYFAVVSAGGGYNGRDQSVGCDSVARWDANATGSRLQPRWIDFTGNDSILSVAVTGAAVYTGGHYRWVNNPYGADSAGSGAIARKGLAAFDPRNGKVLSWNPGRTLGVGVFDMLATGAGLWIGHDTNTVAGESRQKLAFFPL